MEAWAGVAAVGHGGALVKVVPGGCSSTEAGGGGEEGEGEEGLGLATRTHTRAAQQEGLRAWMWLKCFRSMSSV